MSENKPKYNLDELLKKSPTEITHEELMFVLDNMDMGALLQAAADKNNQNFLNFVEPKPEQSN